MKTMKIMSVLLIMASTYGCSNGIPTITESAPDSISNATHKTFIGVPILLSMEGSFVDLGNGWAVTAAHNRPILELTFKDVFYHDKCDIALFRYESELEQTKIGFIFKGDAVYHSGYPVMMPMAYSKGEYLGDVFMSDRPECQASLSNASVMGGMSGGGVWNQDGELVGINVGYSGDITNSDGIVIESPAIFQSMNGVRDWFNNIVNSK